MNVRAWEEEGLNIAVANSAEDVKFFSEEIAFFKSVQGYFDDFSSKVQKLISKNESSRLHSYPSG